MKAAGGVAPFNLTDGRTGEVTAVEWYAPALNTIFYRFDEEEVRFIIVYGRAFSPMSPWGLDGGGPLNAQQVDTLLAYLASIQIERENCGEGEDDPRLCDSGHLPAEDQADIDELANRAVEDGEFASYGEALFNLNLASGAYSCARCHTPGWSWGDPGVPGQGAFGWNLTDGAVDTHFPNEADMIDFIKTGYRARRQVRHPGPGQRAHAGLRPDADRRADRSHRRLRAEPLAMNALLAITWEPELRGILIVIIAVVTLCGSIYLVLGTNLGARLGFLVALSGLAGWMALMGGIWWIYGIGLKGPEPSWEAIPGRTVIQDTERAAQRRRARRPPDDSRGRLVPRGGRSRRGAVRQRGLGAARRVRAVVRSGRVVGR